MGIWISHLALFFGLLFFIYAMKYYISTILVLYLNNFNSLEDLKEIEDVNHTPFISIQLPFYNEINVASRILQACLNLDYENYEVMVLDDSRDETTKLIRDVRWRYSSRLKIIHRGNREGYKGAALSKALRYMHPETDYIMVLDADFVPPPDIIKRFIHELKGAEERGGKPIAAVQGYQLHILNKDENWLTKGVRTEFSGSYMVERVAEEYYGGMKMVSGSVFLFDARVLKELGWGKSITEDWELTIRLYLKGYRVIYSPLIAASAEIPTSVNRLAKQRMRWAEGHTYNVKKYFWKVLSSPLLTLAEKLEFLYFAPYYLQSFFFIIGSICWILSEILHCSPKFWPPIFGWSLMISNLLALPLMSLAGLYIEGDLRSDLNGIMGFLITSYLLAPFQGYAALKGLMEKEEGTWIRTLKTGSVTDQLLSFSLKDFLDKLLRWGKKQNYVYPVNPDKESRIPIKGLIMAAAITLLLLPFIICLYMVR
jgi:cellulose synthase/poly-beta-1,6-N-acetylglucosamine synthase-like glycosyltransferase